MTLVTSHLWRHTAIAFIIAFGWDALISNPVEGAIAGAGFYFGRELGQAYEAYERKKPIIWLQHFVDWWSAVLGALAYLFLASL